MDKAQTKSISVSQLNRYVKRLIETQSVLRNITIRGELSNVKVYSSGHWYFSLKDEHAQVSCVMFRSSARSLKFKPKDGDSVLIKGNVNLYERDGRFQVIVNKMEPQGKGNLYILFEQLNKKLAKEGLYDQKYKQKIPKLPKLIGVATSRSGAVIHDVINVSKRRFPMAKILLCPCSVQGPGSKESIVKAIEVLNSIDAVDTIIVGRGGGSLEDLWSFNTEEVARAIFKSKKPIISAVGHESDTTISDYVADLRAPTPSAAAELAMPTQESLYTYLDEASLKLQRNLSAKVKFIDVSVNNYSNLLKRTMLSKFENLEQYLDNLANNNYLKNPYEAIDTKRKDLNILSERLITTMKSLIRTDKQNLARSTASLEALSPLKILSRGYAMVSFTGDDRPIVSVDKINKDDSLDLHMQDGKLEVKVKDKFKDERG